jgi:hypothetical protein
VFWREELDSINPIPILAEETLRREWVRGYKRPQTGWQHHLKTNRQGFHTFPIILVNSHNLLLHLAYYIFLPQVERRSSQARV